MNVNGSWIVSGTDTGIGKTVFSALLTKKMNGVYWKPIQAGLELNYYGSTDRERVQKLTGLNKDRHFYPESYVFEHPLSPFAASEVEGVQILPSRLKLPEVQKPLIVEGAGGLLVPFTKKLLQIDIFQNWRIPLILCARTALGTMNHTLLSIEAIQKRGIPFLGIVFIGESQPFTEDFITSYSGVKKLGSLPFLTDLCEIEKNEELFDNFFNEEDFLSEKEKIFTDHSLSF